MSDVLIQAKADLDMTLWTRELYQRPRGWGFESHLGDMSVSAF